MAVPTPPPKPAIDETVICERRKHWINVAPVLVACALLILFLPIASYFYARHMTEINKYIPSAAIGSLMLVYLLLVVSIALLSLYIYRQNRLVLTNHHLVEYTRRGIFSHTTSQFSLIKLQDVSSTQNGPLANMLNYGNITIETAGEEENFVFAQVPRPQELANQIMQAHEALADSLPAEARSV